MQWYSKLIHAAKSPRGIPTGFENITVDNTVKTLNGGVYSKSTAAFVTVATHPIRYRMDNMATATISDDVLALLTHARPCFVDVDGNIFLRVEATPGDNEFTDANELAAGIDELKHWIGAESTGSVIVTSTGMKDKHKGFNILVSIDHNETSGGDASTAASVIVLEAIFTELQNGDTIEFAGVTFTKAAQTSVANNRFANAAGFASCVDELGDWGATGVDNVTITADDDGAEWNGFEVIVTLRRETALVDVTDTVGHLGSVGEQFELRTRQEIENFRATRDTGNSGNIYVTYYQ